MTKRIELHIEVPNQTRYLSLIGRLAENLAHEVSSFIVHDDSLVQSINIVLTESIVNAIKHANPTAAVKQVIIKICVSDSELIIGVYDCGQGFDLDSIPMVQTSSDILKECGRGIFIIRSLMDSVRYRRNMGWNVLEMRKILL